MKKKICKSSRLVLLFLLLALISGCGESHADTPEFSTSKDRNTGFAPKTFQQQHETENQEAEEISKQVESGTAAVEQHANEISAELQKREG